MGVGHRAGGGHHIGAGDTMGKGYGKLLLFGEHAVVHGHPAVGVGCNLYTSLVFKVDVSPHRSGRAARLHDEPCSVSAGGRSLAVHGIEPGDRDSIEAAIARGLAAGGPSARLPEAANTIVVDSTVPRGVGLGSSAALCAAIAEAICNNGADDAPPDAARSDSRYLARRATLAHEIEHLYHGKPSGVDTALSVYGGIRAFARGEGAESPRGGAGARSWPLYPAGDSPVTFLYGYVPRSGNTRTLVGRVSQALSRGDRDAVERIAELGGLSEEAIAELDARRPDAKVLGSLAWRAQAALSALGLSTPALDRVLAAGRRAGARGGKLSGAGGGGAWYLLFDDPDRAEAGRTAIREAIPDTPVFTMPLVTANQT